MKNNIKKALVKFRENLLYFQHFMLIFVCAQISDYHHLKHFQFSFFGHARINCQCHTFWYKFAVFYILVKFCVFISFTVGIHSKCDIGWRSCSRYDS